MRFTVAAAQSANLAVAYIGEVEILQRDWRAALLASSNPRAVAAFGRTKAVVGEAMAQLELAGVLIRASQGVGSRTWEAAGLLDLLGNFELGVNPSEGD